MRFGNYVVCKVKTINPHSVFVETIDGKKEGMIHISEVASGWIKNIRRHVRENQIVVAKILREDRWLHLSLKRVDEHEKKEIMKKYNLEIRGRKLLRIVAKQLNVSYAELKKKINERFEITYEVFTTALENPEKLNFLPKDIREAIIEVAKRNIKPKEKIIQIDLTLSTLEPNGIKTIKRILGKIKTLNLDVKYISAPKYLVVYKTREKKEKKEVEKIINKIEDMIKHENVEYKLEVRR